jgi:hypothetical protein
MSRSVGELLGAAVVDRWNFFNVEGYLYVHPAVLMADVGCKDSVGTLVEIESSVVRSGVTAFGEMTSCAKGRVHVVNPHAPTCGAAAGTARDWKRKYIERPCSRHLGLRPRAGDR